MCMVRMTAGNHEVREKITDKAIIGMKSAMVPTALTQRAQYAKEAASVHFYLLAGTRSL